MSQNSPDKFTITGKQKLNLDLFNLIFYYIITKP